MRLSEELLPALLNSEQRRTELRCASKAWFMTSQISNHQLAGIRDLAPSHANAFAR